MTQRRHTRQRTIVLDAVKECGNHPSAEEVCVRVHEVDPCVSRGTVYRNLNILAEEGEILQLNFARTMHFDHRTDPHTHVICKICGAIEDVPIDYIAGYDDQITELTGYTGCTHLAVFEGICPHCQEHACGSCKPRAS